MAYAVQFSEFEMPDGSWMRFEIGNQVVKDPSTGDPMFTPLNAVFSTPTASPACPLNAYPSFEHSLRDIGELSIRTCKMSFVNDVIITSGGATWTFIEWLNNQSTFSTRWHIRFYQRDKGSSDFLFTTADALKFWGIFELAEPNGEMPLPDNPLTYTFTLTAQDALMLMELMPCTYGNFGNPETNTWGTTPAGYGYTIAPAAWKLIQWDLSGVYTTAYNLTGVNFDYGFRYTTGPNGINSVRVKDLIRMCGKCVGFDGYVNQISGVETDVESTTRYMIRATGDTSDREKKFDDLYIPCSAGGSGGGGRMNGNTFFDTTPEKSSNISVYHFGSVLELLKMLLEAYGLHAELRSETSGGVESVFLWISEMSKADNTDVENIMLHPVSIEEGEAEYGISVAIANEGVVTIGATGGSNIDIPFQCASQILIDPYFNTSGTPYHQFTNFYQCFLQSVWAYHAGTNELYSVGKINVYNAGAGPRTIYPTVTGTLSWTSDDLKKWSYSTLFAWAIAYYRFTIEEEGSGQSAVGITRRLATSLKFPVDHMRFDLRPGGYVSGVIGFTGKWQIVESNCIGESCHTEIKVSRGKFF